MVVPAAVFAARQSGEALKEGRFASVDAAFGRRIAEHEAFATPLLWASAALGLASLALVLLRRSGRLTGAAGVAASALTVVLAVVTGYYVLRSGHTGATAVWAL